MTRTTSIVIHVFAVFGPWACIRAQTMNPAAYHALVTTAVEPDSSVVVTVGRGLVAVAHVSPGVPNPTRITVAVRGMRRDSSMVDVVPSTWNRILTTDGRLRIDVTPPASAGYQWVQVFIIVPDAVKLLHVQLTAGTVSVTKYAGDLVVESDSGNVTGDQLTGGLVIETRDGSIDVGLGTGPRHSVNFLARNGNIQLTTPGTATQVALSCGAPTLSSSDKAAEWSAIQAAGIAAPQTGCDVTDAPAPATGSVSGLQLLLGHWADGGGEVNLRTLRGGITLRRR